MTCSFFRTEGREQQILHFVHEPLKTFTNLTSCATYTGCSTTAFANSPRFQEFWRGIMGISEKAKKCKSLGRICRNIVQSSTCWIVPFLGAFAKLRWVTISFVKSVRMFVYPSALVEQLGSHWEDIHKIWYLIIFRKSIEKNKFSLKSDNNNG